MASAVDGLKAKLVAVSQPDDDGVYRDGAAKRARRVDIVLESLRQLWADAIASMGADAPDHGVGLAAVGSLARRQIGPCSDLDLVLIYDSHAISDANVTKLADKLWYPLWDSGLDLDHSVRTRQQCEAVTDSDLPAAMGWLDVLPVAGDTDLIRRTADSILERWRKAARKRLPELTDSAKERFDRFGQLPYLNQPDIKEARGGLRDTVLVSALATSWLADRPHGSYDDAVEHLLDARDCIHLAANKDTNMLLPAYQVKVAKMMGLSDPTIPDPDQRDGESIENMQTVLARYGRRIAFALDSTASRAAHSLTHEQPRFSFFQMFQPRGGGRREAPRFDIIAEGVARHEGEAVLAPGADPTKDRTLALRVAVAAAENDLPIAPGTLTNIKRCALRDTAWTPESRDRFVRLLATGPALLRTWEELDFVDIPGRLIPEWLGIRNRPSASAAHRYTIDRHMVEVVSRLDRSAPTGERYDDEHYTVLLMAGILHDIGKRPRISDHAAEGARHVPAIMKRMLFDEKTIDMVTTLVREHLTLSEFASTKSPDDEQATEELAARLGNDPLMLDMLFDLTRADGSSLGATAGEQITKKYGWSKWRASLVGAMYRAARADAVRAQRSQTAAQ
ncbi:HD domain-containing protein [Bifidobacterium sp. SMB2]|uniref:HD domain-containing protein n=1 Tax=Bifidobacterium saimiriisciurei TaxID=2661627 RepID=A0ABX0CD71_9BIFI|nr:MULTISPECIES: HD domain-containing protein [Bifidobacterium]NEG97053.1 HD domain-containing protein [Bifidobacterium sp. SMB2]NEH12171.1 HD domain-containing protein [Bifidobacterium saimiriisciurei]